MSNTRMKRIDASRLPPIEVDARPEKLALAVPLDLKVSVEQFAQYFAQTSGQTPTSFNAVVIGILTGYLEGHKGYQAWLKAHSRARRESAPDPGT